MRWNRALLRTKQYAAQEPRSGPNKAKLRWVSRISPGGTCGASVDGVVWCDSRQATDWYPRSGFLRRDVYIKVLNPKRWKVTAGGATTAVTSANRQEPFPGLGIQIGCRFHKATPIP